MTVTVEHVNEAITDLKARGMLANTDSDMPDGRRSAGRWLAAIREDAGIIGFTLENTLKHPDEFDNTQSIRYALKEARRLESDIYRFADEVHGIDRKTIDDTRV